MLLKTVFLTLWWLTLVDGIIDYDEYKQEIREVHYEEQRAERVQTG